MFKARVGESTYEIESSDGTLLINGVPFNWDVVEINTGYFHILFKGKSFRAEIVKTDRQARAFVLKINNRKYTVELKDKFDLLLAKMGMNNATASKINLIKAPMPGLIVELKVSPGDPVKSGDALLVLEAMKMENILKSTGDGIVKSVKIKKGDSVEKGQVLIEF
jgi:biotin carboxyl carrier protein